MATIAMTLIVSGAARAQPPAARTPGATSPSSPGTPSTPGSLDPAGVPSAADLETARALFKEGKALRAGGDLTGALAKFRAAHAAGRTPVTGIELARTQEQLGQLVEARETALDVARIPVARDETKRSAEARADALRLADDLALRIPEVIIRIDEGDPEAGARRSPRSPTVLVDGEILSPALLGQPRKVDPGSHTITVRNDRIGGGEAAGQSETSVELDERESRVVDVTFVDAKPTIDASSRVPDGLVYGVSFALVPQLYLPSETDSSDYKPVSEVTAGIVAEAGLALTPDFEILLRGIATAGSRGKPFSELVGLGPSMSFSFGRWRAGASLYAARADMVFEDLRYSTDTVFLTTLDIGLAVIPWRTGQWILSLSPGYFFVNERLDNPLFVLPILFGFRSF